MFADMPETALDGAIEALLFVSDAPVNALTLAEMLECEPSTVIDALQRVAQKLESQSSGILLREVAGGWRLYTNPQYHELLERYVLSWDTRRLSQAALETLAIIAYGQPITRLGITSIRGVNSDSSVNSLLEKGLVRESGQADAPGYPMTYSTTQTFLEKFGLRDTGDLPALEQFAPDEEIAALLRDGLQAHAGVTLREEAETLPDFDLEAATDSETIESGQEALSAAMRNALSDALAESAGIVQKINFDELEFEE